MKNSYVIDMDKDYNKLEAPSFLISRQHRIVLLWKSSVAVSADAVSAQAGMIYRPTRERDIETLKESARIMLQKTGHEEISFKFFKFQ